MATSEKGGAKMIKQMVLTAKLAEKIIQHPQIANSLGLKANIKTDREKGGKYGYDRSSNFFRSF